MQMSRFYGSFYFGWAFLQGRDHMKKKRQAENPRLSYNRMYNFGKIVNWLRRAGLSYSPRGGCSIPPFFSQFPIGWISAESTSRQKSFLLSLPSRRRRRRAPVSPTTVAIQVDVVFLGSCASSFMLILNSLLGGVQD